MEQRGKMNGWEYLYEESKRPLTRGDVVVLIFCSCCFRFIFHYVLFLTKLAKQQAFLYFSAIIVMIEFLIESKNMALTAGIVGLPNVGKSTLFNAITNAGAEVANYPFATIDPNVGMVEVPDERLQKLTELITPKKTVPTTLNLLILPAS